MTSLLLHLQRILHSQGHLSQKILNNIQIKCHRNYHCHSTKQLRRFISSAKENDQKQQQQQQQQQQQDDQTKSNTPTTSITDYLDDLKYIPLEDTRNFCIIAHVDHGKSSLASRILELTGNLLPTSVSTDNNTSTASSTTSKEQIDSLDTLTVERQRGITVKASAASMLHPHPLATNPTNRILLNMVDTPGHADFGFEVTRSLRCVQGAVILFDACQGVQAQTLSVYDEAVRWGVTLIPALTKCDREGAMILETSLAVGEFFGFDPDNVLVTSARTRVGIEEVLDAVVRQIPAPTPLSPTSTSSSMLLAQVVDSWFEPLRGVICLVKILSGTLSETDRISVIEPSSYSSSTPPKDHHSVQDVGLMLPKRIRTGQLHIGQMGYVIVGLRDPRQARSGSFIVSQKDMASSNSLLLTLPTQLPSTTTTTSQPTSSSSSRSALFASVHPTSVDKFDDLLTAVEKLALNDTGLEIHRSKGNATSSDADGGPFLGPGLRIGFQGLLHVEVFRQRLEDEFEMTAIVTPPKVPYHITFLPQKHMRRTPPPVTIEDLIDWPSPGTRITVSEPVVSIRIVSPMEHAGAIMSLVTSKRGSQLVTTPVDDRTWLFEAEMPWAEVVADFHDELKTASKGYASFDVKETGDEEMRFVKADLTKVEVILNGDTVEPLAFVSVRSLAQTQARVVCRKLKEVLPRRQFAVVVQAKADGKILASERIKPYRKDVLTIGGGKTVGGGDVTRKKKLLEKQKKGKKRQQAVGKVTLSQEAFNSVISRSK